MPKTMNIRSLLAHQETNLRKKIKKYKTVAKEIKTYLDKHPDDWGRFQSDFNMEINGIFRDLMNFEKECLSKGDEESVYKLKRIFINRLRKEFLYGDLIKWSLEKPYGYAGDFKIIDLIYQNSPQSSGIDRLYDNYFQMSAISIAVRNRKEDFKKIIWSFVEKSPKKSLRIMDLASGPCRDICELMAENNLANKKVQFECYDSDNNAIKYAKEILNKHSAAVNFNNQNAVRIALMKDVTIKIPHKFDIIFSTGLFDYLDYGVSVRLISNLKKLLADGGILAISDVRDKFSNPSIYFMEWVADWSLIYRSDDDFRNIFLDAGFVDKNLSCCYEQQGVMQYIIASNRSPSIGVHDGGIAGQFYKRSPEQEGELIRKIKDAVGHRGKRIDTSYGKY